MKLIKNVAAALLLAAALNVNIYAGDLDTPGAVPPPPRPATCPADDTDTAKTTQEMEIQESTLADELWVDALMSLLSLY